MVLSAARSRYGPGKPVRKRSDWKNACAPGRGWPVRRVSSRGMSSLESHRRCPAAARSPPSLEGHRRESASPITPPASPPIHELEKQPPAPRPPGLSEGPEGQVAGAALSSSRGGRGRRGGVPGAGVRVPLAGGAGVGVPLAGGAGMGGAVRLGCGGAGCRSPGVRGSPGPEQRDQRGWGRHGRGEGGAGLRRPAAALWAEGLSGWAHTSPRSCS